MIPVHHPASDCYTVRDEAGTLLGGAATDASGRWTWWHLSTYARRIRVDSREAAIAALAAA